MSKELEDALQNTEFDNSTAMQKRLDVLEDILTERIRQDEKWGGIDHDDTHTFHDWSRYIQNQRDKIDDLILYGGEYKDVPSIRKKFINIAALAVAAVESIDRRYDPKITNTIGEEDES
jgi:hypothetical protein